MTAKTVVITGGGSGIGLSAALHFARHGWHVGVIGRSEATLRSAQAKITGAGGTGAFAVADVADSAELERAADKLEAALGPVDVWVNNAAIGYYGKFADVPEAAFRQVIEVNLFGTVNGTRIALKRMGRRRRGTIVQVLSAIAYRSIPLQSAYGTSKYGLRGFTEAVRSELIHDRSPLHITMVHPPSVNTPFYSHAGSVLSRAPRPPPPVYQPELIGEAIYVAATGERRREWKVTGESLGFIIGNKIAPGLIDRLSGRFAVAVQQTTNATVVQARDPNTFSGATRDLGEHGPFDAESLATSLQWTINRSSAATKLGIGLLALGLFALARPRG